MTVTPSLSTFSLLLSTTKPPFLNPSFFTSRQIVLPSHSHSNFFTKNPSFFIKSPPINMRQSSLMRSRLESSSASLICPDDHWGVWTALFATGAFGLWSEKTRVGSVVSAALVSILTGLAASNLRIIPFEAPAYSTVLQYLLPLTVPLLLFRANMHQLIKSTGRLLLAFLLGSVATLVGTVISFSLVPMRSIGPDGWKIAAALMGSYIGGTVNYIAISEALGVSPSIVAAGVAADNVVSAIYLMMLFALASFVPPEATKSTNDVEITSQSKAEEVKLSMLPTASAIAVSFAICKCATHLTKFYGIQGGTLPISTAVVVVLATLFPKVFSNLAPSAHALSSVSMQVFFAVIGASGSVWNVINTAPSIFLFAFVQLTVHLAIILGIGRLFQFELKLLLLASNANVGGPTTASGMATAKGWGALVIPGVLAGIFGISIATFVGIGFGLTVLKNM